MELLKQEPAYLRGGVATPPIFSPSLLYASWYVPPGMPGAVPLRPPSLPPQTDQDSDFQMKRRTLSRANATWLTILSCIGFVVTWTNVLIFVMHGPRKLGVFVRGNPWMDIMFLSTVYCITSNDDLDIMRRIVPLRRVRRVTYLIWASTIMVLTYQQSQVTGLLMLNPTTWLPEPGLLPSMDTLLLAVRVFVIALPIKVATIWFADAAVAVTKKD
jgi:hypothetical protein